MTFSKQRPRTQMTTPFSPFAQPRYSSPAAIQRPVQNLRQSLEMRHMSSVNNVVRTPPSGASILKKPIIRRNQSYQSFMEKGAFPEAQTPDGSPSHSQYLDPMVKYWRGDYNPLYLHSLDNRLEM